MTRVFVGNLPYTLKQEELLKEAKDAKLNPKEATIATLQRTGRPLGFGFLTFNTEDEAKKALNILKEKKFGDRVCRVEIAYEENVAKARKENLLYVGNLPEIATTEDLSNIFDGFKLVRSEIVKQRGSDKGKGFGYVAFETKEDMEKAIKTCAGTTVEGKEIVLEVARPRVKPRRSVPRRSRRTSPNKPSSVSRPRRSREGATEPKRERERERPTRPARVQRERIPDDQREKSECTVHVGNLAFKAESGDVQKHFEKYKPKTANVVRRKNGGSKGFAFVDFATVADANAALALNGSKILDREITVNIAFKKFEPTPETK